MPLGSRLFPVAPPPVQTRLTEGTKLRFFSPWLPLLTLVWLAIFLTFFDQPLALASRHWPLVIAGIFGALLGNTTAIGGGIIFMPLLIGVYHLDPLSALKLTLVTQAVGMTSGAVGWIRRDVVPHAPLKWTIPPLIVGSSLSTFVVHPNAVLVKGLFGPISIVVGVLALLLATREGSTDVVPPSASSRLAAVSLVGGLLTGWVAIGEGEVVAAFLMLGYGVRGPQGIGLGVVLLSINSIFLALVHSLHFGGVPWHLAIFTTLGVLWGGRLGPYVAQYLDSQKLKQVFGCVAIVDGTLFLGQFLLPLLRGGK